MNTNTGYRKLLAGDSGGRICNNPECRTVEDIVSDYVPIWPERIRPMRLLTGGAETPWVELKCCPSCGEGMEEVGVDALIGSDLPHGSLMMAAHMDNSELEKITINCPCGEAIKVERRNWVAKCDDCGRFFDRYQQHNKYGHWYWQWGLSR